MQLDPSRYKCAIHDNIDYLTASVRAAVIDGEIVMTERMPEADVANLLGRNNRGSFRVVVDCPGEPADPKPHPLTFTGKWSA
jgi:hypothetical protein